MHYLNIRNNYAANLIISVVIGIFLRPHLSYYFPVFLLLSSAYIIISVPYLILQAISKLSLSLSFTISFLFCYWVLFLFFRKIKVDQNLIESFIQFHQGVDFWVIFFPFLIVNIFSIFLLKIKEDSKKINDLSSNN